MRCVADEKTRRGRCERMSRPSMSAASGKPPHRQRAMAHTIRITGPTTRSQQDPFPATNKASRNGDGTRHGETHLSLSKDSTREGAGEILLAQVLCHQPPPEELEGGGIRHYDLSDWSGGSTGPQSPE